MQFDQFAGDYKQVLDRSISVSGEDSSYFAEYKAQYLARILGRDFAGKILDFGCGVGLLSSFIRKHLHHSRLDGFDVSRESIARVSQALAASGVFTSDEKFLGHNYDVIVTANVMHHVVPADRSKTVGDLVTRLAAHGRLAIIEHNPANPLTRRAVDRCPFDEDAVLLRPQETESLMRGAGLKVIRKDYIVFMPRFLAWLRRLEPSLAWLPLGAQYAVVGEKHA